MFGRIVKYIERILEWSLPEIHEDNSKQIEELKRAEQERDEFIRKERLRIEQERNKSRFLTN